MKRGLSYAEAMAYVGVKRRTFDAAWRPRLSVMHQGTSLIFDRNDLDRVFDELKSGKAIDETAQDRAQPTRQGENGDRNERPPMKGVATWADEYRVSNPRAKDGGGSTSATQALDFTGVASRILRKRKSG
jgi:hypothetical protein